MSEPLVRKREEDTRNPPEKERSGKDAPVEKWRPFEEYDRFRAPGFWRGDEVKPNQRPSSRPNRDRRSSIEDISLEDAAQRVAMEGRYGDTELAHVTPEEKLLLAMNGGSGTQNPSTGLIEFFTEEKAPADDTWVKDADMVASLPDKDVIEELKAIREMIREAKAAGKIDDKKTLRAITKRHKKLLENLIDNALEIKKDKLLAATEQDPKQMAAELEQFGRNGDTMLAHITPEEAQLLKDRGGSGTINPDTGLPEFFEGSTGADSHGSNSSGMAGGDPGGGLGGHSGGQTADLSPGDQAAIAAGGLIDTSIGPYGGDPTYGGKDEGTRAVEAANAAARGAGPFSQDFGNIGFQGEGEISDNRNAPITSYQTGITGFFQDPIGLVNAKMQGFFNEVQANPFGTIAGALAGAVVGAVTKGLATGLVGPAAGQVAGMVTSNLASNAVNNAVTSAVANATNVNQSAPTTVASIDNVTNPNQSAPGNTPSSDMRGADGGTDNQPQDSRVAPLTSASVNPLTTQPTPVAGGANVVNNPFSTGIYIPPVGAPTAGIPLLLRRT